MTPLRVDAAGVSLARRPRLYWLTSRLSFGAAGRPACRSKWLLEQPDLQTRLHALPHSFHCFRQPFETPQRLHVQIWSTCLPAQFSPRRHPASSRWVWSPQENSLSIVLAWVSPPSKRPSHGIVRQHEEPAGSSAQVARFLPRILISWSTLSGPSHPAQMPVSGATANARLIRRIPCQWMSMMLAPTCLQAAKVSDLPPSRTGRHRKIALAQIAKLSWGALGSATNVNWSHW